MSKIRSVEAVLRLFVLLTALGVILADISVGKCTHPDYPGTFRHKDLILPPRKHPNPNGCGEVKCLKNGLACIYSCGSINIVITGCTMGEYAGERGYPGCCIRKIYCPNNPELDGKFIP